MAENTSTNPTLLDLAKVKDPDGSIAAVVEILNQQNEVLPDMSWREGNLTTGHKTTVRTGLPAPTWRKLGGGVQPTKATTAQITFGTGMLENYNEVDKALADLDNNTAAFRLSQSRPTIEGINKEMADTLFYGNETSEPEAFTGLSPMFNSLTADNKENIIEGGGTGTDNGSIWLIVWSPETVFGIVPKGSTAGLTVRDLGEVTVENVDGSNGRMQAYRTHFRWDAGLAVPDWRFVVRIANIDKSAIVKDAATGADLPDLMFQAIEQVPNLSMGRAAFYMSRTMRTWVRRQSADKVKNATLTIEQVGGVPVMFFHGVPLRRVDALAADEARVV